ncbi:hypothetical protein F4820DRAFT_468555 [Hypoxylon rubiginosum]|uniref:Uncharacterized protein n=1 Tax=Hypoxylon rubiginosum TaxID=110542 RepID=A0ACB9Z539_9PEZI|nr:hypothetical protein F4820DRAFT_468555 [Hypoxylon rubiginosum]
MTLVGVGVGIAVGVLTGGAGFAISAGLAISAGVASDVATGAIYDAASGKTPTWESVGEDAAYGLIGGVVGEAGGRIIGKGIKTAVKRLSRGAASRSGARAVTAAAAAETTARAASSSGTMGSLAYRVRSGTLLGAVQHHVDEIAYFDSLGGVLGNEGLLTHGNPGGQLLGLTARPGEIAMLGADSVVLGTVRPLMREAAAANPALAAIRAEGRPFHLIACYGANSGAGQRFADALKRPVVAFYGEVQPLRAGIQRTTVYNALETPGGFERIYGQLPTRRFDPLEAMDWQ